MIGNGRVYSSDWEEGRVVLVIGMWVGSFR